MNSTTTTQETVIMPPIPPVAGDNDFTPGEFEYVCDWDRSYIRDAYQVITRNEWWGPFKAALLARGVDSKTGFQFTNDALYNKIMKAISSTDIGRGHSGSSMGSVMRAMQNIALHGEAEYRRQWIEYQANADERRQNALLTRQAEEAALRQRYDELEVLSILIRLLAIDNSDSLLLRNTESGLESTLPPIPPSTTTTTETTPQHMETTVEETIFPSENTDTTDSFLLRNPESGLESTLPPTPPSILW